MNDWTTETLRTITMALKNRDYHSIENLQKELKRIPSDGEFITAFRELTDEVKTAIYDIEGVS